MLELTLVNKENRLASDYVPSGLVEIDNPFFRSSYGDLALMINFQVKEAFLELQQEALVNGYMVYVDSGYRPYTYQENVLKAMVQEIGDEAYLKVAPPGASEHQTGLAIDIGTVIDGKYIDELEDNMIVTKWLHENAHRFGFILRYPKGKEEVTGFNYEPWHLRYVGREVAYQMREEEKTLEEYLKVRGLGK